MPGCPYCGWLDNSGSHNIPITPRTHCCNPRKQHERPFYLEYAEVKELLSCINLPVHLYDRLHEHVGRMELAIERYESLKQDMSAARGVEALTHMISTMTQELRKKAIKPYQTDKLIGASQQLVEALKGGGK